MSGGEFIEMFKARRLKAQAAEIKIAGMSEAQAKEALMLCVRELLRISDNPAANHVLIATRVLVAFDNVKIDV